MFVLKIGGAAGLDHEALCQDIAALWRSGAQLVIVHGGSADTDVLAQQLNHAPRTIVTPSGHHSRYTDRQTLEIFAMATARLNRLLVERLQQLDVPAFGMSGVDGRLLQARRKATLRSVEDGRVRIIRDDWTGSVTGVNKALLRTLLTAGYLPIIAPLAISDGGEMVNVDGDRAAAAIAGALQAETLVLLSNVAGLMRNFPDPTTVVAQLSQAELAAAGEWAQGRMKKKLMGAQEALSAGVGTVVIGDGRRATPLQDALAGHGTTISAAGVQQPALAAVEAHA